MHPYVCLLCTSCLTYNTFASRNPQSNNLCTSVLLPPPHPLPSSIWWFISSYSEGKLLHQSLYNPSRQKRVKQIGRCKLNFPTYLFHNLHLGLWIIRAVYKKTFFFFFISEGICAKREVRHMRNNLRQVHRQIEMTAATALHQQFCSVRRSMLSNMKF